MIVDSLKQFSKLIANIEDERDNMVNEFDWTSIKIELKHIFFYLVCSEMSQIFFAIIVKGSLFTLFIYHKFLFNIIFFAYFLLQLAQAHDQIVVPLENFRKDRIGGVKENKKKFDKKTAKFCQAQERFLNMSSKKPDNTIQEVNIFYTLFIWFLVDT